MGLEALSSSEFGKLISSLLILPEAEKKYELSSGNYYIAEKHFKYLKYPIYMKYFLPKNPKLLEKTFFAKIS